MARKGGPKSRKRRYTGTAALRALRSVPKAQRSDIKTAVRKATGTTGKLSRKQKVGVGKSIRKQRIARGRNPNTGTGSLATHAIRRAKKKGMISKSLARRTIRDIHARDVTEKMARRPGSRRGRHSAGVAAMVTGKTVAGWSPRKKVGVAAAGKAYAKGYKGRRKAAAAAPAPKKAAPKKGGGGGVFRQAYKKTLPGIGKKALAKRVATARSSKRASTKAARADRAAYDAKAPAKKPTKKPTRTSRAR